MAVVAGSTALNVIGSFPSSDHAIVTAAAGTDHLGVVNRNGWHEHSRVVAVLTNIAGLDMRRVLADRLSAVMTAGAVARDTCVIEVGG